MNPIALPLTFKACVSATIVLVNGYTNPNPTPNILRQKINYHSFYEKIDKIPKIVKINDDEIEAFFLPNLSDNYPVITEPTRTPQNKQDIINSLKPSFKFHSFETILIIIAKTSPSAPSAAIHILIEKKAFI